MSAIFEVGNGSTDEIYVAFDIFVLCRIDRN